MRRTGMLAPVIGATAALAFAALPTPASAYTVDPAWQASDFATSFPTTGSVTGVGPTGLAIGPTDRLYVSDSTDGSVYAFGTSGGAAPANLLTGAPLVSPVDLAFTPDGRLYATQGGGPQDVVELNPLTGAFLRVVSSGLPNPAGLAVDPVSGDLFVAEQLPGPTGAIDRIENPGSDTPTYQGGYATGLDMPRGIAFGADGTLYAADDAASGNVWAIGGTRSASPGTMTSLGTVNEPAGIAAAKSFLLVSGNDGRITQIGLSSPHTQKTILSGASRGDIATVGADGCGYFTESDRVLKLTNADGSCSLQPTVQFNPALFPRLKVSLAGVGRGSVSGGTVACPPSCSRGYTLGTAVTLRATAARGSKFMGWSGPCSGTGTCTITMNSPKTLVANFGRPPACTLKPTASKVSRRHTLTLKVQCDQAAKLTLSGIVTAGGKHLKIKPVKATLRAGAKKTLVVAIPALPANKRASASFTLAATNAAGTSRTTAKVKRLSGG